jgi:hypothetical protein
MRNLMLIAAGVVLFLAGCQPVASPVMGFIYLDAKGPIAATQGTGMREGTACAKSIMVASVDHHSTSTLGIVGEFCTIVRGK